MNLELGQKILVLDEELIDHILDFRQGKNEPVRGVSLSVHWLSHCKKIDEGMDLIC